MGRIAEIEARLADISNELQVETADVEALRKETDILIEERKGLLEKAETRKKLLDNISQNHTGNIVRTFETNDKKVDDEREADYRSAFLKKLIGEELNDQERAAFTHTTTNTGAVIPKELQNKIYSSMEEKHPILADVQVLRTGAVISIAKHTAIVAGDAKVVNEGQANDDEQNTFVNVALSGKDFSKHIDFSYRLGKMAIPAFEAYLVKEIADRMGAAMAKEIITQIKADLAVANKFTPVVPAKLAMVDILKALSLLKQTGKVFVYTNSSTLYSSIANMEGVEGRLSFLPNYQEAIAGQVLGKGIKEEDALANGEVLFLDPDQFIFNVVQDIMIERDKDIKTHTHTIAGFAIAGGTMTNDKAGSIITVTIGG